MCYEDMKRDHKENRKESKERTLTPGKGSKSPKCFSYPPRQIFCQHFAHQIIKGGNERTSLTIMQENIFQEIKLWECLQSIS